MMFVLNGVNINFLWSQTKNKNLTILNFAQIWHANSNLWKEQLCQFLGKAVKYFSSYDPLIDWNLTPKIGLDRYGAYFLVLFPLTQRVLYSTDERSTLYKSVQF